MGGGEKTGRWQQVACTSIVAMAVVLCSVPVSAAPAAGLSNPRALEHFAAAQEAFDREDYVAAIPELKAAYALEPSPQLLYAWAQAERLTGDCGRALKLYKQYLETGPAEQQRQLAQANIVDCEAEVGGGGAVVAPVPLNDGSGDDPVAGDDAASGDATDNAADDPTAGADTPPGGKPWYKDWLAPTLAGTGLVAAGAGGALVALGVQQGRGAPDAITEMDYFDEGDAARGKHTAGWVLIGVGGALIVGGAIRYALVATKGSRKSKKQARLSPSIGRRSAGLVVRF